MILDYNGGDDAGELEMRISGGYVQYTTDGALRHNLDRHRRLSGASGC